MLVVSLHVLLKVRVTVLEASLSRMEEKTDWGGSQVEKKRKN